MSILFPNHRKEEFKEARLIFDTQPETTGAEVKVEFGGTGSDAEFNIEKLKYEPDKSYQEHWERIEERYGQTPYEALISAYVDRIMPKTVEGHKEALIKNSLTRYTAFYLRVRQEFMKKGRKIKEDFEFAVDNIVSKTKEDLSILKSAVEGGRPLAEMPDVIPSPENKGDVKGYFENYVTALGGRYLNAHVNEGIKIPGSVPLLNPLLHPNTHINSPLYPGERSNVPLFGIFTASRVFRGKVYEEKARNFQSRMQDWVKHKLTWLLDRKGTTQQDLIAFRDEITQRYQNYAGIDKDSTIISGRDFATLEEAASPPLDALHQMLDASNETVFNRLEVLHLLHPDVWKRTVKLVGQSVVSAVEDNGNEAIFIATMKKYGEVKSFKDAKNVFWQKLGEVSPVGARETLDFLRAVNSEVHSDTQQYELNIEPKSLTLQVKKQIDYLLSGALRAKRDTDRMLVRFMQGDLEARNEILANEGKRDLLFRAIRAATERYPEVFEKMKVSGDTGKLRRAEAIGSPSGHDQSAQLMALIVFGRQARVIVENLSKKPEHSGKGYMEELEKAPIPERDTDVVTGLRFSEVKGPARFRSTLERSGFNSRDLFLDMAKVLAVAGVLSNVAQSYSETSGDFVDRVAKTLEKTATNQGTLASAAVLTGAHLAKRHPAFLHYPWLSQFERKHLWAAVKLENIGARLGPRGHIEVKRFVFNPAEWQALEHEEMTGAQIKQLMETANKRTKPGYKPMITVEDVEGVVKNHEITDNLTRGGASARMRFLFYAKFFASEDKPLVNDVKEACTGSSSISKSPNKTA